MGFATPAKEKTDDNYYDSSSDADGLQKYHQKYNHTKGRVSMEINTGHSTLASLLTVGVISTEPETVSETVCEASADNFSEDTFIITEKVSAEFDKSRILSAREASSARYRDLRVISALK